MPQGQQKEGAEGGSHPWQLRLQDTAVRQTTTASTRRHGDALTQEYEAGA